MGVSAKEKPHIRSGGNKVKVNSTLQSLDDKLRIANKVNWNIYDTNFKFYVENYELFVWHVEIYVKRVELHVQHVELNVEHVGLYEKDVKF